MPGWRRDQLWLSAEWPGPSECAAEAGLTDPEAEATHPRMVAWKRAEAHIPYSKEWKRVIRALGEARGKVRPAYQHKMREELKERDPQFKKWSDLNDRIEELKREQIYRLHDYLLRHTEHPNLLGDGRNRGELEDAARQLDSARRSLQELKL